AFFSFVSFFPQLVAGPIERSKNLLPQFLASRVFNFQKASDGMRQILWGLFKKMVIADNCAVYVNEIFENYQHQSGSTLLLGAFFFTFQIYGDFSGYSDIAIGCGKLLGFNLTRNFNSPYLSRNLAEFWQRWHISLSSWFKEYVYIPLGGNRHGRWYWLRNIYITFIISGLWHGANWTFILWGTLHACFYSLSHFCTTAYPNNSGPLFTSIKNMLQISATFLIILFTWIFFRAKNIEQAFQYISGIYSPTFLSWPHYLSYKLLLLIAGLMITEWFQRNKPHALHMNTNSIPKFVRWPIYWVLIASLFFWGAEQQEFIYFQF
ncbi:MAG: MBOAT family protein, partial [Fibrobacteria bacterium]|nr:MBOAT family protein [Fibrobacteria bacterium]